LSQKRLRSLILWSAPCNSPLETYWLGPIHRNYLPHLRKYYKKWHVTDAEQVQENWIKHLEQKSQDDKSNHFIPVSFVPFEKAREYVQKVIEVLDFEGKECPVCFQEILVEQNWVTLHGEKRHRICSDCNAALLKRQCPLCREVL
jgi:hypothetical protein